ncbi:MAG: DNA polymerase III subunit delta [Congregibacter sp.]
MRLYPEKLDQDLQRQLRRVYLVSGDEMLLVQECADLIRAAARRAGCGERRVLDASESGFGWQDLLQDANSLSLFAEQRLLELRIPNGKPGSEGSKTLCEYLAQTESEDVLLIVAGKIDKASTNSKWYKAIDEAGATVQVWPVKAEELPRWLERRAQSMQIHIERDALGVLAERVEGNLLAAVQELEKLRLIAGDQLITAERVADTVGNSARFNVFGLLDTALAGRSDDSLRMLQGLRAEGAQPPALLWGFVRELRQLRGLTQLVATGRPPTQALAEARVWKSRQSILQAALGRHNTQSIESLLTLAARIDGSVKGYADGNPWELMEWLVLGLARRGETPGFLRLG